MRIQLTHMAYPTRQFDRMVRFYCELCDMRNVKARVDATHEVRVVWLAPEATDLPILVIIEDDDAPEVERRREPFGRHLGFEVDTRADVDAKARQFADAGIEVSGPTYVNDIVGYIFLARDPDGHAVEFNAEQDVSPKNWD